MAFSYDGLNRLTLVDNPLSGSAANDVDRSFVYDLLGRMTRAQDQNGHFAEMGYDALGRQTSEASLNGGTKTMQYDAAGRRTRLTWPDQFFVSYDYNNAGDMTHIRENGAQSGAGVLATFGYDDLGRRTSLARGNGAETTYGYDAAGRLSHVGHHIPTPTGLFEPFTYYSYNAAGQILSVNRPDSLAYSGLTNQNVTDSHNGLNQVTTTGGAATAHDARGNTTADGSGTTFLYNLANELVAKNGATQLYYEPLGRLTQQWNGGGTLDWVGSQLIADYSGGFGNRRHVHGPGVDEPLVTYENGQRRHLHADERGSVVMLTDDASAVTATNRYDEYGQPQGGSVAGRFGFTGQAWLPEIGVHYYKARMYDHRGRFMQPDPIGYGDGMNLYAYVGGDPVNFTDPLGLQIVVTGTRIKRPQNQRGGIARTGTGAPMLQHPEAIEISDGGPEHPDDKCVTPPGARYRSREISAVQAVRHNRQLRRRGGDNNERSFVIMPLDNGRSTFRRGFVGTERSVRIPSVIGSSGAGHDHSIGGGDTLSSADNVGTGGGYGRVQSGFRGDREQMRNLLDWLESQGQDVSDYMSVLGTERGQIRAWYGRDLSGDGVLIGRVQCQR